MASYTSYSNTMSPTSILTWASSNSQLSHLFSFSIISWARSETNFFSRNSPKISSSNTPLIMNSRRGSRPAYVIAARNRSCLTISNVSWIVKSSAGFSRFVCLLQGIGSPSFEQGLNWRSESFMQSKRTLLWMCSHSAMKVVDTSPLAVGLAGLVSSEICFSRASFRRFSRVRYRSRGST